MRTDPAQIVTTTPTVASTAAVPQRVVDEGERALFGPSGFGFHSILEIVNPLQHIPIVGSLYREITGDTIGAAPRILGGGLFGGVFGLIGSALSAVFEGLTGKDPLGHVVAAVAGETTDGSNATQKQAAKCYEYAASLSEQESRVLGTVACV
jgi:hypothetical protein